MKRKNIYGEINFISDIRKINERIREDIKRAKTKPRITKLVRRSGYICTLTFSPSFKKKLYGKLLKARKMAEEEYTRTAKLANKKLGRKVYDERWG